MGSIVTFLVKVSGAVAGIYSGIPGLIFSAFMILWLGYDLFNMLETSVVETE